MTTSAESAGSARQPVAVPVAPTVEDLCLPAVKAVLVVWAVLCVGLWLFLGIHPDDRAVLAGASGLALAIFVASLAVSRHPRLAALLLLAVLSATIVLAAALGGNPAYLSFLCVAILASGALVAPAASLAASALAAALAFALAPAGAQGGWLAILFVAVGVTAWAAYRPQHSLLLLTWQRSISATMLSERLRDKQGQLNKTIKALDLSYQLLEKTNAEVIAARKEAEMLRDMRNRFATNLSHELRTPLNIVLGFANLIYRKPRLYGYEQWNSALLRDLAQLQRNAHYLSKLVDDVVDLARVDALAMPVRRAPARIDQVIAEAVESVYTLAERKGLQILVSCPAGLPEVPMDALRVKQVLFNLLSNAVRFTDQGTVSVTASIDERELVVAVSDTGPGIPPGELSTIFDEFYQVSRPKTGADPGKGLGLAIARRFVHLHGGRIWAESEPGHGSTFTFTLPLSGMGVSRLKGPAPVPAPRARAPATVLVLSHDESPCLYLSRRIEGYDFAFAPNLEVAESLLAGSTVAAILIDSSLGLGAAEVRRSLGERWPANLPVVECPLPSTRWLSAGGDFQAVLTKPVAAEDVLATLARLLDGQDSARVLIVDDDRGFVLLMRRMLQASDRGYQLDSAYSGTEALRKMRRSPPACVLLDLVLPEMNGFEVAKAIRADPQLGNIPVVAISAATPGEDNLTAQGATLSLSKRNPFRPGELKELLSAIFRIACEGTTLPDSDAGPQEAVPEIPAY